MRRRDRRPRVATEPPIPLAPGTPVRLCGEPYAGSFGHVVLIHGQAAQVHVDAGEGTGHEVVVGRGRLVPLPQLDPQEEQIA